MQVGDHRDDHDDDDDDDHHDDDYDDDDDDDGDLQVHDCLIIILGCLSGIEENLVFAFATKGWHMYFGTGMSALRWAE